MMQEMVPTGPTSRGPGAAAGARGEAGQKRQKNRSLPDDGDKRREQTRPQQRRRSPSPPPPPQSQSPPPPPPPSTSEVRAPASVAKSVATDCEGDGDDLGAGRASYGDDLDTLDRRRSEELKLIGEYDSATINPRRECWFIVDTKWLQCWAKFVRGEGPPPGRISNEALVEDDLKTPVEGLVSRVDYRGVNPAVWFLYLEMYGKDSAQDLCRYVIDLYEAEVPPKYRREIYEEPMRRGQVEVQKMRWRVEPDEVRMPDKPRLCCCITEGVIDCVFMALFTCGAKCRRRCPRWLCCCTRRTNATGGRYSRVTTGGEAEDDDDYDSELDGEVDFGAREEEEDLQRLRGGGRGGGGAPRR